MIFIDSNIPMYLIGEAHPHKIDSRRILEELIAAGERLVTDAEVLQEILHRYTAIDRRDAIQPAFNVLLDIADEVYSITPDDVCVAKDVLFGHSDFSARDALHIAIMKREGITQILSFDRGFAGFPGISLLPR